MRLVPRISSWHHKLLLYEFRDNVEPRGHRRLADAQKGRGRVVGTEPVAVWNFMSLNVTYCKALDLVSLLLPSMTLHRLVQRSKESSLVSLRPEMQRELWNPWKQICAFLKYIQSNEHDCCPRKLWSFNHLHRSVRKGIERFLKRHLIFFNIMHSNPPAVGRLCLPFWNWAKCQIVWHAQSSPGDRHILPFSQNIHDLKEVSATCKLHHNDSLWLVTRARNMQLRSHCRLWINPSVSGLRVIKVLPTKQSFKVELSTMNSLTLRRCRINFKPQWIHLFSLKAYIFGCRGPKGQCKTLQCHLVACVGHNMSLNKQMPFYCLRTKEKKPTFSSVVSPLILNDICQQLQALVLGQKNIEAQ